MKPHDWFIEELDCGHLGVEDVWSCRACKASGGMPYTWDREGHLHDRSPTPFLPGNFEEGHSAPIDLPEDCEEAQAKIKEILLRGAGPR